MRPHAEPAEPAPPYRLNAEGSRCSFTSAERLILSLRYGLRCGMLQMGWHLLASWRGALPVPYVNSPHRALHSSSPPSSLTHHHSGHRNCHHFLTYSGSQFHSHGATNFWTSHCTLLRSGLSEQVRAWDTLLSLGKGWEGKSARHSHGRDRCPGWHVKHGRCHRPVPVLHVLRIYLTVCFKIV